jgi:hypothetical protein
MKRLFRPALCSLVFAVLLDGCGFPGPPLFEGGAAGSGGTTSAGGAGGAGGATTAGGAGGSECSFGQTETCYDGPEGTLGVAMCKAGERSCEATGMWGPCEGQVVPATEDASTPGDENCDTWTGACQWQKRFGDPSQQDLYRISVMADGAFFITGHTVGPIDFGDAIQSGSIYVAKRDKDGNPLWSRSFAAGTAHGSAVAAHPDGGAVVTGSVYQVPVDFGGGVLDPLGKGAGVAARLDENGGHVWSKLIGSGDGADTLSVAVGPGGDIAVGIWCLGPGELLGTPVDCGPGQSFVAKLDPATGEPLWISPSLFVSPSQRVEYIPALAVDSNGNVIASGSMTGKVVTGGGELGEPGYLTGFVLQLNSADGTVAWARKLGPHPPTVRGTDVALAPDGGRVVVTALDGPHDFGGGCVAGDVKPPDVTVVKYTDSGACSWIKSFSIPGYQEPKGVAVAADGAIAVGGVFKGPLDFGFGPHPSDAGTDIFLLKLDASGKPLWSRAFGDTTDGNYPDWLWGVGVDGAGYIYAAGTFDGIVDFCDSGLAMTEAGFTDMWVAKYAP